MGCDALNFYLALRRCGRLGCCGWLPSHWVLFSNWILFGCWRIRLNALMALPNLLALILLAPVVLQIDP